jgi:thymidylate synthase (FAD)
MPEPDYMGLQSTSNKQGRGEAVDPDVARVIREQLLINYYDSWTTYQQLLEKGLAKELARMVLPVATYSQFYVSGNLHSFMHFMKLRSDSHAQKEIQDYSNAMMDILVELFPIVMTAWRDIIILPK